MSPFERKVVHDAVAAAGLTSESEGDEPRRYVVVLPREDRGRHDRRATPLFHVKHPPCPDDGPGGVRVDRLRARRAAYADLLADRRGDPWTDRPARGPPALGPAPAELRGAGRRAPRRRRPCATSAPAPGCRGWCWRSAGRTCGSRWWSRCCGAPPSCPRSSSGSGWTTSRCVAGRAEELHGSAEFTVVTSRAVAPLRRLLAWSMPLVRAGRCVGRDEGVVCSGRGQRGSQRPGVVGCRRGRGVHSG